MYEADPYIISIFGNNVRHGFFGRRGGISTGIYESLNCGLGTKDDPAHVAENRRRALEKLGLPPESLITLWQNHTSVCLDAEEIPTGTRPEADALVTDRPGQALGILTADCAPVLFAGKTTDGRRVIGAAHAGWRGALTGILESTIAAMKVKGAVPDTIAATVGPCIGPDSYEVTTDFMLPFLNQTPGNRRFFRHGQDDKHSQFDLPGYVAARLSTAGIAKISVIPADTYAHPDKYFSFRRTTHRGESDYGRQLSVIALTPEV